MVTLSLLKEQDLHFVKEVYDFYILNSTATFHTDPITIEELKSFLPIGQKRYPSFIIIYNNRPCGYCYLSMYKQRQAYNRSGEVTIYLKPEVAGKGIGKEVLERLEIIAIENGIKVLLGIISGDNISSIKLFEKFGYEKCAHFKQVGEKFGRVLDVVAYQKITDR